MIFSTSLKKINHNIIDSKNIIYLYLALMGFVSGIPFLLTLSTLSVWFTQSQIDLKTIGIFTAVNIPYALKFLWAPLIENFQLPLLRKIHPIKRFGIIACFGIVVGLFCLAFCNPAKDLYLIAILCLVTIFCAATHDMVLDYLRINNSDQSNIGSGVVSATIGFRFGMIASGAGAIYISAMTSWKMSYLIMAILCAFSMVAILKIPLAKHVEKKAPTPIKEMFKSPLQDLLTRNRILSVIFVIFFTKIASSIINGFSAPFLLNIGISAIDYASITKVYGVILMIFGSFMGGLIVNKISSFICLYIALIMQVIAVFLFLLLDHLGNNLSIVMSAISIESFSSGMLATGFTSLVSLFVKPQFSASQFTILYSLGSLSRIVTNAIGGFVAHNYGWSTLFFLAGIGALSVLAVISLRFKKYSIDNTK